VLSPGSEVVVAATDAMDVTTAPSLSASSNADAQEDVNGRLVDVNPFSESTVTRLAWLPPLPVDIY
jgi:hypothetical protein